MQCLRSPKRFFVHKVKSTLPKWIYDEFLFTSRALGEAVKL